MESYLKALRTRHAAVQAEIDAEQGRPSPDHLTLGGLKRIKLRLHEIIERVERDVSEARAAMVAGPGVMVEAAARRRKRDRLFGAVGAQYRSLKRRIADLLARRDGDYGELSAASQELGVLRRALRNRIARLRAKKRKLRAAPAL